MTHSPRTPTPRAAVAAALILTALAAGCLGADGGGNDAPLQDLGSREWSLEPGGYGEVNIELSAGDQVVANYTTDGPSVTWDVHSHGDDGVRTHDSGAGVSGTIDFTAEEDGVHSIYWQVPEDAAALTLTVTVRGHGDVQSWAPY